MADFEHIRTRFADRLRGLEYGGPRSFSPERAESARATRREVCAVCIRTIAAGAPAFVDSSSGLVAHPSCFWRERKRALGWYGRRTAAPAPSPAFDLRRAVSAETLGVTGCALNLCDRGIGPGELVWRDLETGHVSCTKCAEKAQRAASRKGRQ
jgi:hypothetical protein